MIIAACMNSAKMWKGKVAPSFVVLYKQDIGHWTTQALYALQLLKKNEADFL